MRFKTGFVVGCAAGFYLTQKARQLRAPLAGRSGWPCQRAGLAEAERAEQLTAMDLRAEKVRALGRPGQGESQATSCAARSGTWHASEPSPCSRAPSPPSEPRRATQRS